jgi:hypothetical protein
MKRFSLAQPYCAEFRLFEDDQIARLQFQFSAHGSWNGGLSLTGQSTTCDDVYRATSADCRDAHPFVGITHLLQGNGPASSTFFPPTTDQRG